MAEVTVTINGRDYRIACDDGQEQHVERLAAGIDKRIGDLVASIGRQVGDATLLVMASLLVADELSDLHAELERANAALAEARDAAASGAAESGDSGAFEAAAQRIEDIVARLENI